MMTDWQPIATAPRDGSKFEGMNSTTESVYLTWYERKYPEDELSAYYAKAFGIAEEDGAVVWWCCDNKGKVTSFLPDLWRPMAETARMTEDVK